MPEKDSEAIRALQYLLDEGFIVPGFRDGEPTLFLTTDLSEAQTAIKAKIRRDPSEDWQNG